MNRLDPPDEQEQFEAYTELVAALKGAPVTIRTLDLGADKQVDGARPDAPATSNPALGLRAVRLCLKDQSLFRPQIRAILRASACGPVRMMIPMLANTTELDQVLRIVRDCKRELDSRSERYDGSMPVGAMIEVPAAAICADIFARRLDFFSIGTNDLIQYTIAIDRIDDEVSYLYDPLHPAVLRLIATTIAAGRKAGNPGRDVRRDGGRRALHEAAPGYGAAGVLGASERAAGGQADHRGDADCARPKDHAAHSALHSCHDASCARRGAESHRKADCGVLRRRSCSREGGGARRGALPVRSRRRLRVDPRSASFAMTDACRYEQPGLSDAVRRNADRVDALGPSRHGIGRDTRRRSGRFRRHRARRRRACRRGHHAR